MARAFIVRRHRSVELFRALRAERPRLSLAENMPRAGRVFCPPPSGSGVFEDDSYQKLWLGDLQSPPPPSRTLRTGPPRALLPMVPWLVLRPNPRGSSQGFAAPRIPRETFDRPHSSSHGGSPSMGSYHTAHYPKCFGRSAAPSTAWRAPRAPANAPANHTPKDDRLTRHTGPGTPDRPCLEAARGLEA